MISHEELQRQSDENWRQIEEIFGLNKPDVRDRLDRTSNRTHHRKRKPEEWGEPCPCCGNPLHHSRMWNPDVFGDEDEDNPYMGWRCHNNDCHYLTVGRYI
jgi:hypothetical protein